MTTSNTTKGYDSFQSAYRDSLLIRLLTQITLPFLACVVFLSIFEDVSPYFTSHFAEDEFPARYALALIWFSFLILLRNYVFHTASFCWGFIAGVCSFKLSADILAALYWSAISSLIISTVKYRLPALYAYMLLVGLPATIAYFILYSDVHLGLFELALAVILLLGIFQDKIWAGIKSFFSSNDDRYKEMWQGKDYFTGKIRKPPTVTISSSRQHAKPELKANAEAKPGAALKPKAELRRVLSPKDEYTLFSQQLQALKQAHRNPGAYKTQIDGIVLFAERIMQSMKDDPKDVKPGGDFLRKYLPMTLSLVESGQRLALLMGVHGEQRTLQEKYLQQLTALHSAFSQQHLRLLENDSLEFETDLSVLDSLLKTDGFK